MTQNYQIVFLYKVMDFNCLSLCGTWYIMLQQYSTGLHLIKILRCCSENLRNKIKS